MKTFPDSLSARTEMTWPRTFARWLAVLCLLALTGSTMACALGRDSAPTAEPAKADTNTRSVIVTVRTALLVDDVTPSSDKVRKLVDKHDGIIATSGIRGTDEDRVADFEVRIPADKLAAFRVDLGGVGELDSESEQVEDVTAPHADLEARLRNARAHEKRLLSLLEEKTGSLTDVVAIEKEIASVRENIERMDAEKRVMDGRIAFATVHIALRPAHTNLWSHPGDAIVSAFGTGLRGARNLVVGSAIVGAAVLPSLLVIVFAAGLMILLVRALLRRRSRRLVARA